jgi:hypothetical protein
MGLVVSCQLGGTCYHYYLVLASTNDEARSGLEAVVVGVAAAKARALGVHTLASEGFILLIAALLGLLFLVHSTAT